MACSAHKASDLASCLEVIRHKGDIWNLLFDLLVIDRDNTYDGFAWDEKQGGASDSYGTICDEVISKGALSINIFIPVYLKATNLVLIR